MDQFLEIFKKVMINVWDILKKMYGGLKKVFSVIYKVLSSIWDQIWLILDAIKTYIIILLIIVVILFLASLIVHNSLRFGEVSYKYTGEYKKLYTVKDSMMNVYQIGEGEQTILILPGFGVATPTMEYKAVADELAKNYKVVIVEYLGSGFSLGTKDKRTVDNMIEEVRLGLGQAEVYGPFVLMPFDISNIYAMHYQNKYPEEVLGIVSVDPMYPEEIKNKDFKEEYLPNLISNVNFYSGISYTGLFRWQTYLEPNKYYIDKMEKNSSYEKKEIVLYRKLFANKFLTKEMRNEIANLGKNMEKLKNYKYPEELPVLQILTDSTINKYNERHENLKKYASDVVTNPTLQKTSIIKGNCKNYLFEKDDALVNLILNNY